MMAERPDEDRSSGDAAAGSDGERFLRDLARKNQELEAQYGGEESLGQKRPMSLWERIQHAIAVLASTGPTR